MCTAPLPHAKICRGNTDGHVPPIGNLISQSLSYFIYKMGFGKKKKKLESSLVVQWLGLHVPNAEAWFNPHAVMTGTWQTKKKKILIQTVETR